MLNYSEYYPAMIAETSKGDYFIYWICLRLIALSDKNYGRGKSHWFEYLGKQEKNECRKLYPHTPVLSADDNRINVFLKSKIKELDDLINSE